MYDTYILFFQKRNGLFTAKLISQNFIEVQVKAKLQPGWADPTTRPRPHKNTPFKNSVVAECLTDATSNKIERGVFALSGDTDEEPKGIELRRESEVDAKDTADCKARTQDFLHLLAHVLRKTGHIHGITDINTRSPAAD